MSAGELTDAVRELIERLSTASASDEARAEAACLVRAASERLGAPGDPPRWEPRNPLAYRRRNPVSGVLNPLAPPVRYDLDAGGNVEASVTFGSAYQGPPGYVHGGFIAGVFDDVLGAANVSSGHPGMTVKLDVRYRKPTPLRTPLRVTARHTGREGRRIFASATMLAGDVVTAEADGVFAEITPTRAAALFAELLGGEEGA